MVCYFDGLGVKRCDMRKAADGNELRLDWYWESLRQRRVVG